MSISLVWKAVARGGAALVISALIACSGAMPAGAVPVTAGGQPVRPHEHFVGLVNGHTGRPHRVAIQMACFGPIKPGQTGHPRAHQTVAVIKVKAGHAASGRTGTGTFIGAFFGAPPPTADSAGFVAFHHYVTKMLPTSLVLPCAGDGTVTFVALPLNPQSRSFEVPVTFAGQP